MVQVTVGVKRIDLPQVEELLQGFVNEDEADEGSKRLLCEPCNVAHQRACVRGNQEQTQEGRPQADAGPQGQVGEVVVPGATFERQLDVMAVTVGMSR